MVKHVVAAGFIIVDDGVIYGHGTTVEDAWKSFEALMAGGDEPIIILPDTAPKPDTSTFFTRRCDNDVVPATLALLVQTADWKVPCCWDIFEGVAALVSEAEAA